LIKYKVYYSRARIKAALFYKTNFAAWRLTLRCYGTGEIIKAHRRSYDRALAEIKKGRKESHWLWFIFPQVAGLGQSSMSQFYAIADVKEAAAYLLRTKYSATQTI
jgi:hypothetical protein